MHEAMYWTQLLQKQSQQTQVHIKSTNYSLTTKNS